MTYCPSLAEQCPVWIPVNHPCPYSSFPSPHGSSFPPHLPLRQALPISVI